MSKVFFSTFHFFRQNATHKFTHLSWVHLHARFRTSLMRFQPEIVTSKRNCKRAVAHIFMSSFCVRFLLSMRFHFDSGSANIASNCTQENVRVNGVTQENTRGVFHQTFFALACNLLLKFSNLLKSYFLQSFSF